MRIIVSLLILLTAPLTRAQITVPQLLPYTSDTNTVILEHFDNSVTGTISGPFAYANGIYGQAGDFVSSTALTWNKPALAQGTVEFWSRISRYTSSSGLPSPYLRWVFAHYSGLPAAETLWVDLGRENQSKFLAFAVNVSVYNWKGFVTQSSVDLNVWNHYAVTWGPFGMHFYLNGAEVASNSDTNAMNPLTAVWGLGSRAGFNEGLTGQIDEFRVSDIQRTFAPATGAPTTAAIYPAVEVAFTSTAGKAYQLQWTTNLSIGPWANSGAWVQGNGSEMSIFDTMRSRNKRFYRVIKLN